MKTKLLEIILNRAVEIMKKQNLPYRNCCVIYNAVLSVCDHPSPDMDYDREEYEDLCKYVQKDRHDISFRQSISFDSAKDKKWDLVFQIWLNMRSRTSIDVYKYIKPCVEAEERDSFLKASGSDKGKDNHSTLMERDIIEAAADENFPTSDEKETREFDDTLSLEGLVQKTVELREHLLGRIVGQNHVVSDFADGYFEGEFHARLNADRKGPKAIFLFAGSPGVGKTFLAAEAANVLNLPVKRFDMSSYATEAAAGELNGYDSNFKSPKPGQLTGFVHDHPESILIFDEIEKANIKVINLFLQILDAGILFDNKHEKNISFRDTIIIFTTNAGKELYQKSGTFDFSGVSKRVILDALEKEVNPATGNPFFPQAIVSRMASGYVFLFNKLTASDLSVIAAERLIEQQEQIREQFSIESRGCEDLASTILFSAGGNSDARSINGAARRFFTNELFELFRLTPPGQRIERVNWTLNFQGADSRIRELYQLPEESTFLFFGEKNPFSDSWNGKRQGLFADSAESARELLKEYEVCFVAIDYLYRSENGPNYLNNEDRRSLGKRFFSELQEFYPDLPVIIWETPEYAYHREEVVSMLERGVESVIRFNIENPEKMQAQIDELLNQIWQQRNLEILSAKHEILTYESAQFVSQDGKEGTIELYDLKLSTVIDAGEQDTVLSAEEKPDLHWEDVVVSEDAKSELQYFQEYLENPKQFIQKGAKAPKGILLYGPPGTGKTSLAKVMATEADVTFLSVSADQFFSRWSGEGPESVHQYFSTARKYAPAILFIDEIDAIGGKRTGRDSTGQQEILNALLTEMDGFKTFPNKPVLVMAATNLGGGNGNTGALDPALVRRFDRSICIDLPDKAARIKVIRMICERNSLIQISEAMIESLAERSLGMSPALIEGAVDAAIREAIRGDTVVDDEVMDEAFERYNSGEEKQWDKNELIRTARHESGHALISQLLGDRPVYLTIVAREQHGGYMRRSGSENKGSYTKKELLDQIAIALGGRAAEIFYYGEEDGLSTGASGDLEAATSTARNMICRFGMYSDIARGVVSEAEAGGLEITRQINEILGAQLDRAVALVKEHKAVMEFLTSQLMEKSHLNKEEMKSIFDRMLKI